MIDLNFEGNFGSGANLVMEYINEVALRVAELERKMDILASTTLPIEVSVLFNQLGLKKPTERTPGTASD